ncbi:MAG: hypothetical protein ABW034_07195 [Steroidobacteraceae bacterium]
MTIRFISWATGGIGAVALRTALKRGYQCVGVLCYDDQKVGKDAGEIAGLELRTGIKATKNKEDIYALDAEIVIHAPMIHPDKPHEFHREVLRLLESGKNVITTVDYFHIAGSRYPELAQEIEAACRKGNSTVMGTGNSPGYIPEVLTTTLTRHVAEIDHIEILEKMDCSYMSPAGFPVMGFGMSPAEFENIGIAKMWDHMFRQSPAAICHLLNAPVDDVLMTRRVGVADKALVLPSKVTVEPGKVVANAWRWSAIVQGKPLVEYETRWMLDAQMPGWEADNSWTITIEGKPSIQLVHKRAVSWKDGIRRGGAYGDEKYPYRECVHGSAGGMLVNSLQGVIDAPPGNFLAPVFGAYQYFDRAVVK